MSLTGLKDVDREILKHVDDRDLLNICKIDNKTWNSVCDDDFLRRRLTHKYPGIEKYKRENESWKQFFLTAIYYIAKLKEKLEYVYTSGDFKQQYKLLSKYKGNIHSLLVASSRKGELPLVKYAIEQGADIREEWNMNIALIHASWKGHLNVVKYLVEKGADISTDEDEALKTAAEHGHFGVVKFLVEQGADIHTEDDYPLRHSSMNGHLPVVKYLVEQGADPSINFFALKYASKNGHLDVVKYLVEHGANPRMQYDIALQLAIENKHTKVAEYLQSFQ